LELGQQQINADVPIDAIRPLTLKASNDIQASEVLLDRYFAKGSRRVADAFRGSTFTYRCIDLVDGDFVINADLNSYSVPVEWRSKFDLVTNHGTSEHIADQINVFRAMHDFLKPGGTFFHVVPFAGYYNHGLFNYQPAFFILLAHANEYDIDQLDLSSPHLAFTIPVRNAMPGTASWAHIRQESGVLLVRMRKSHDRKFSLFTDYDVNLLGQRVMSGPWAEIMAERYDLRVR
jgi:SAM-dependent methyltransferase